MANNETFTRAQKHWNAAKRFQAEAKKWRALQWKTGLFTKKRREYEKKAQIAAANAKEQLRLWRAAKKGARKTVRAQKKDARGQAKTDKTRGKDKPERAGKEEALPDVEQSSMEDIAPERPAFPWVYAGGALIVVLATVFALSRRPVEAAAPAYRANPRRNRRRQGRSRAATGG